MKVVGVDGCRAGWFAVWGSHRSDIQCGLFQNFSALWDAHCDAQCILVDIPMGLTDDSPRQIEPLIRPMLGRKSSSVFPVPCRTAVYATDYAQACEVNQARYGKRISRQSWNICPKIREVDRFLLSHPDSVHTIGESHPELAFAILAGRELDTSKKTPAGIRQRLKILNRYRAGSSVVYDNALLVYPRKEVARDDVVDAMVLQIAAKDVQRLACEEVGEGGIPIRMNVPSTESLLSSPDFIC